MKTWKSTWLIGFLWVALAACGDDGEGSGASDADGGSDGSIADGMPADAAAPDPALETLAALWSSIQSDYQSWARPTGFAGDFSPALELSAHANYVRIFMNDTLAGNLAGAPMGSIVVKHAYGQPNEGSLAAIAVMQRVAENGDADDWFYGVLSAQGEPSMAGSVEGCINCHDADQNGDYLFINDNNLDILRGQTVWNEEIVGRDYTTWDRPPAPWDSDFVSRPGGEHGEFVRVFINDIAAGDLMNYPAGSIIVKHGYNAANEGSFTGTASVMYKVDQYDPNNADWFWAIVQVADNSVLAAGKIADCSGCHSSAEGGDLSFIND